MSSRACGCRAGEHQTRLVVLTGGPGAGKTAVLEIARRTFCEHIAILPEAATIVFGGGFWRKDTPPARRAAQRVIFHVQQEMERLVIEEQQPAVALCDRGTLDGVAYWPDDEETFWKDVHSNREAELARYSAVIHLRSPSELHGYNRRNPIRIESAAEAQKLDERVLALWRHHLHLFVVESTADFLDKARLALQLIHDQLPVCCRSTSDRHDLNLDVNLE